MDASDDLVEGLLSFGEFTARGFPDRVPEAVPGVLVVEVGRGEVGEHAAVEQGPDAFGRVQVRCAGRRLEHGQPIGGVDELPHLGAQVPVEIVPDQDERGAEPGVCQDEEVAVPVVR